MYKVVWITKFRQGMDVEEARRWWLEVHGPLFLAIPGVLRYVQNHWETPNVNWEDEDPAVEDMAYHGHAEAWFESKEAFDAALQTDEFKKAIEDLPAVFDLDTMVSGFLTEYVLKWDALTDGRVFKTADAVSGR